MNYQTAVPSIMIIKGEQSVSNPFELSKEVEMRDETDVERELIYKISSDVYDQRSTKGTDRISAQTGFYSKEI
jgi:hypothetical protein